MFGLSSWEAGGRFTEIPNRVFYFGELGRQWINPSKSHKFEISPADVLEKSWVRLILVSRWGQAGN